MRSEERDAIDVLLEEGLASYCRQEPRPGLEQRVLHRIRAAGPARRRAFLRWALPLAAALLVAIGLRMRHPAEIAPVKPPSPPVAEQRPEPVREQKRIRRAAVKHRAWPRQEQFPAPAPMTSQERALLVFVQRAPQKALEAFSGSPEPGIEPIRIEEIKIQPLQSDGLE